MTREIRKPKPKFRPAPLRQARSAARGNPKPETRSSKLDPWRSGTGSEATAPESRNRNGRGEPRNTRNTRKEGGETLSFLFRVFPVFSGSVRLWKTLAACEQFGLLQCRGRKVETGNRISRDGTNAQTPSAKAPASPRLERSLDLAIAPQTDLAVPHLSRTPANAAYGLVRRGRNPATAPIVGGSRLAQSAAHATGETDELP